jgi:hypothetical protein
MYGSCKSVQAIPNYKLVFSPFFFNNFRSRTYESFPIIYGDENDREQSKKQSKSKDITPKEVQQSVIDFYYQSLMLCAQDDILKVNPVLKLELYEVMGYLSYRLDKAHKENQRNQKSIQ